MVEQPQEQPDAVGRLILHDGSVELVDDAARALVETHGGSWQDPTGPRRVIASVPDGSTGFRVPWASPTGGIRWWLVDSTPAPRSRRQIEIRDLTGRHPSPRTTDVTALKSRLDQLEALAGMGSWVLDVVGRTVEWSAGLRAIFGFGPDTPFDFDTFLSCVHPDDSARMYRALADGMASGAPFAFSHRILTRDSTVRTVECRCELTTDDQGAPTVVVGLARDVTEEHRARTELAYLASHDPLTRIANRRRVTERLQECLSGPAGATLLLVDIDHFKNVNDTFGHAAGDRVLGHVTRILSAHLVEDELLGRLGGDEFAVVLPRCDPAHGIALAEQLCAAVADEPLVEANASVRVTLSIGTTAVTSGHPAEAVLAGADFALYRAKDAGRNTARLHHEAPARTKADRTANRR